ncbi:efflux transporter outer membrane subunit [Vitreoscilla massiliensis]|uniref:Efflux transporter outer membrane subunit n=1 Tax=Vitreoscilla massiliensis TaxID=1689272 RepID=A0ABY4E0K9_9NEIS|nr:efflux transporter outer membrane subunit [Vitreoscilla massiliensis]UOO89332.1 efflux transporter outer membrane subunit [Vitreoscilla massiliensis]
MERSIYRSGGLAALMLTLVAACQSQYPHSIAPHNTEQLVGAYPHTQSNNMRSLYWDEYFQDDVLESLLHRALVSNKDLQLASLQILEAQAAYGIQRSELFPSINAGVDGQRARTAKDLNLPGLPAINEQYSASVGLQSWELDLWGRIANMNRAALQRFFASEANAKAVRNSIMNQVANQYLALAELNERIALAEQSRATFQESVRIFKRRYEVGAGAKTEYVQAQTLLSNADTLLHQLNQQKQNHEHMLSVLVGEPVRVFTGRLDTENFVNRDLLVGTPSDLLLNRPEIVAAEYQLQAADADILAARAAFFPRIALTANVGTASNEFNNLFSGGNGIWSVVPSISVPIFNAGRLRANVDLAQIRQNMAVVNYEKAIQTSFREVADALSDQVWLNRQVLSQKQALQAASERARLARISYDYGVVTYLEVLDAERELLSAQQSWVQTKRNVLQAQVALYFALGGDAYLKPSMNS